MSDELAALREELVALRARVEAMEQFVVIEKDRESGKLTCSINADELMLYEHEKERSGAIELFFKAGAPHLAMVNREGKEVFDAMETKDGKAVVRVFGDDDSARVNLTTDDHGFGAVAVFGAGKSALAVMRADEHGGKIAVMPPQGKSMAVLSMFNGPGVQFYSHEGTTVGLGANGNGGGLIIADAQGKQLVGLGTTEGGSILTLDDALGKRGMTFTVKPESRTMWIARHNTEKDGFSIVADAKGTGFYLLRSGQTVAHLGDVWQGFTVESTVPGHEMKLGTEELIVGAGLSLRSTTGVNLELRSAPVGEQISIRNKDSAPLVKLGATAGGGHLALFNELGLEVAELGAGEHGGAFQILGATGPQLLATAGPEGGVVVVRDAEGQTVASLPPDVDVQTEEDE